MYHLNHFKLHRFMIFQFQQLVSTDLLQMHTLTVLILEVTLLTGRVKTESTLANVCVFQ